MISGYDARTLVAEVVDEHDLGQELRRRAVQDAVNGAEERRPALVVEGDDDAGVGEVFGIQLRLTAAHTHTQLQPVSMVERKNICPVTQKHASDLIPHC